MRTMSYSNIRCMVKKLILYLIQVRTTVYPFSSVGERDPPEMNTDFLVQPKPRLISLSLFHMNQLKINLITLILSVHDGELKGDPDYLDYCYFATGKKSFPCYQLQLFHNNK